MERERYKCLPVSPGKIFPCVRVCVCLSLSYFGGDSSSSPPLAFVGKLVSSLSFSLFFFPPVCREEWSSGLPALLADCTEGCKRAGERERERDR